MGGFSLAKIGIMFGGAVTLIAAIVALWYRADAATTRADAAEAKTKIAVDANATFVRLQEAIKETAAANAESAIRLEKAAKEITDASKSFNAAVQANPGSKDPLSPADQRDLGILFPAPP